MGIPRHYSQDLPERCLYLIDKLLPSVCELGVAGEEHLGPLTTTFLVAMSTPIVTLPIERVERHRGKAHQDLEGYVDDRPISPELASAVDAALGDAPLEQSPFCIADTWRFAFVPYEVGHNVAREFPEHLAAELDADAALQHAREMPASSWARCLRNALAHGGLVYLDANGRQSFGQPTEMIAFVSARFPSGNLQKPPEQLLSLRITRDDYLNFLRLWVGWLRSSRLSEAVAA